MSGDGEERSRPRFEEQAALRELQDLRLAIEESRGRRKRANEAFDTFVSSFGTRSQKAAPLDPPQVARPPEPPPRDRVMAHDPVATMAPLSDLPAGGPRLDDPRAVPAALTFSPPSRRRLAPAAVVAAVVVIGFALVFAWRSRGTDDEPVPPPTAAVPQSSVPGASTAVPAAPVVAPAAELSTVRRVWVRVLVDGERAIERELPANARVPIAATSRIVVRTGDAGAVRLTVGGKDQGPLGGDGEVVTKTFTVGEINR